MRRVTIPVAQTSPPMPSDIELTEAARLNPTEVVARLGSADSGLVASEAADRLGHFGPAAGEDDPCQGPQAHQGLTAHDSYRIKGPESHRPLPPRRGRA